MTPLASPARDWKDQIIQGDSLSILKQLPSDGVDLVITSHPYADSRIDWPKLVRFASANLPDERAPP
jgi:DNA modification methylase